MVQVLAGLAVAFGALVVVQNWSTCVRSTPGGFNAPVPLVGGVALALGLAGFERTRPFWWVGFVVDLGVLYLPFGLAAAIREARRMSRRRTVHRFVSETPVRRDEITLFQTGECTMRAEFSPPGRQTAWEGHPVRSACLFADWSPDGTGFAIRGFDGERVLLIVRDGDHFRSAETGYVAVEEADRLDGLSLVETPSPPGSLR